ncbi:hypothetical protein A4X13_0g5758 [Tilletia indica]|uniref:WIBG Mago-binding domain-containing protein n=1 Tax=Tilletia indica TaxID=43049 RepID=A0A177TL56_9BASI|nr:hypothetical protein A4X13_0g5758 [Tilletia indica]
MSRPPLFPVASVAGIVEDPSTQQRIIPASVRADGSVRKERRIKPGFTPQEDVTRFRSTRQAAAANARRVVPGSGIPGAPGPSTRIDLPASSSASSAGLSKAAKKNAKRRAARASAGGVGGTAAFDDEDEDGEEDEEEDVPDAWDEDDAEGSTNSGSKSARSPPPSSSATPSTRSNTDAQPTTTTANGTSSVDDTTAEAVDPAKRAKALAKKIRAAETLREKAGGGETLLPEQQAKVDSLDALVAELAALEIKDD